MTNSVDPDQLASSEANWSGSTLFAKTGHVVLSKGRVKTNEPAHSRTYNKTYETRKDSDQPAHAPSMISCLSLFG